MASGSKTAVICAVCGNTVILISKFAAFLMTGSGSMLSETIHSLADVLNQILLLIGINRSAKKADLKYPVGYGRERYFWALISAVGIFFLGCGVTVYHGITGLLHPHEMENLTLAMAVLVGSFFIEAAVFWYAWKGLKHAAEGRPFLNFLKNEADPTATAVLLEDFAACLGILLALSGIILSKLTGETYWDSLGSITIGLLLGAVAIFLIAKNHSLLIGQAVRVEVRKKVKEIIRDNSNVEKLVELKARMIDQETFDITMNIQFDGEVIAEKLDSKIKEKYEAIQSFEDFKSFAKEYADDVVRLLGEEIDSIEQELMDQIPEAKYIDIEVS